MHTECLGLISIKASRTKKEVRKKEGMKHSDL